MFDSLETLAVLTCAGVYFLFLLKKALARELQAISLLLFHRPHPGFLFYKLLVFPGIVIHELSHWLMAEILQVKTGEIKLLPQNDPDSPIGDKRLGFVKIAKTDPLRSALIGFAPLLVGLVLLVFLAYLLFSSSANISLTLLFSYLLLVIGNGMLVSRSDVKFWPLLLLLLLLLYYLFSIISPSLPTTQLASWTRIVARAIFTAAGIELAVVFFLFSLRSLLEKITHRRISFS